jgi:hypothetical protein
MNAVVNQALRDHVRYTGDGKPSEPVGAPLPLGDPASGVFVPQKKDLRDAMTETIDLAQASADAAALYTPAYFKDRPAFMASATVWSVGTRLNARTGEVWDVVASGEDFTHPVSGIKVKNVISPSRVFDDFSLLPDGDLTRATTGQDYLVYPATGIRKPRIASGFMTYDPAANAGGYASVKMEEPIVHMWGRFVLGPSTTSGGVVALIPWATDIGASQDLGFVSATAGHFVIGAESWVIGTFPGGAGAQSILGSGTFATPLADDGATLHTMEMWLDPNEETAIIALPDGQVLKFSGSGWQVTKGYFACAEIFRNGGATDALPGFESWGASVEKDELLRGYQRLEDYRTSIVAKEGVYAVPADITLNNTYQLVPSAIVNCYFPASGKILVTICCYVEVTTPGDIVLTIQTGGTVLTSVNGVGDASGWKTIARVINAPALIDQTFPLSIGARAFTGAGKVKLDNDRYTPCISAVGLLA